MNYLNNSETIPNIAVIVCTYNPQEIVFSRVLNAIESLIIPNELSLECVIVDNNSASPITTMSCVKNFLNKCPWAKVVMEPQQGLSFARVAGVTASKAPIIVFIDDDNEVSSDYIKVVKNHYESFPCVAAWGPGVVSVEFLEPSTPWFEKNCKLYFQEKYSESIQYGSVVAEWMKFYPIGTGLTLKRCVFEQYYQHLLNGKFNVTGRKGGNLSSGEDIQIVWEAVKMGYAAGTSPELKINHIIPKHRANINYVRRLTFATSSSFVPSITQSFPATKHSYTIPSNIKILMKVVKIILTRLLICKHDLKSKIDFLIIDLIEYLGFLSGLQKVKNSTELSWIDKFAKLLSLV